MAITSINIAQNNYEGDSNLMSVHNPLVFLVNATYISSPPLVLYCDVIDSGNTVLGTFKCIPYLDILANIRQFMFIADSILRGYMESFDDFVQSSGSIEYCNGITKEFTLRFYEDASPQTDLDIVAIHAATQIGSNPNKENIFLNEANTYYGIEGKPVYMYFYNSDESNIISDIPGMSENIVLDYDDEEFSDFDDELFEAITT